MFRLMLVSHNSHNTYRSYTTYKSYIRKEDPFPFTLRRERATIGVACCQVVRRGVPYKGMIRP